MKLSAAFFVSALLVLAAIGGRQVITGQAASKTVWDGVFTVAQADRGREFYLHDCAECHGPNLDDGDEKDLKGERFWSDWQELTVGYMLRRISQNMPYAEDGSRAGTLPMSTYTDILAHILRSNGFPAGTGELTEASSASIDIVKKGGTSELPSNAFIHVVGCLGKGQGSDWQISKSSRPARVLQGQTPNVSAPLGDRTYALKFVLTALDSYVGHRMSVTATLMGEGGRDGLNVRSISSVAATCQ